MINNETVSRHLTNDTCSLFVISTHCIEYIEQLVVVDYWPLTGHHDQQLWMMMTMIDLNIIDQQWIVVDEIDVDWYQIEHVFAMANAATNEYSYYESFLPSLLVSE
jgi:hypothetical protein